MFKNIKSNRDGFTIVETLIVLAIAAVIIIIVLLAVPALQRTARNNDIKSDSSTVAGEINEFESDNNGGLPNTVTATSGALSVNSVATPVCGTAATITGAQAVTANIASSDTVVCDTLTATAAPTWSGSSTTAGAGGTAGGTISVGGIVVDPGQTCTTTGTLTPAARSFAIFYPIEGPNIVGCLTA